MNQQEILAIAMDKAIDVWDLGILAAYREEQQMVFTRDFCLDNLTDQQCKVYFRFW
jgi:hypothetical protein